MTESIQTTADTAAAKDLRAVYAAPTLTELCVHVTALSDGPRNEGLAGSTTAYVS